MTFYCLDIIRKILTHMITVFSYDPYMIFQKYVTPPQSVAKYKKHTQLRGFFQENRARLLNLKIEIM